MKQFRSGNTGGRKSRIPGERGTYLLIAAALVLTVLRIGIMMNTPALLVADSVQDDANQVFLARQLYLGKWLGNYTPLTLIRNASFSFFTALSAKAGIPFYMLLGLFYAFSSFMMVLSVKDAFPGRLVKLILYLVLLYAPAGFDTQLCRTGRNALFYPSVLLVTACVFGVFESLRKKWAVYLFWLLMLGAGFFFFYYLREDSVWLWPLLIAGLCFSAADLLTEGRDKLMKMLPRTAALLLPVAVFFLLGGLYRHQNDVHYGAALTNDVTQGSFGDLASDILRVADGRLYEESRTGTPDETDETDIWVTRETLEAVADACPSLSGNKDVFLDMYDAWGGGKGAEGLPGDYYVWALRGAMTQLGWFENAGTLETQCRRADEELREAFKSGKLQRTHPLPLMKNARGYTIRTMPYYLSQSAKRFFRVCRLDNCMSTLLTSQGNAGEIRAIEAMTGANVIYPDTILTGGFDKVVPELADDYVRNEIDDMRELQLHCTGFAQGVIGFYRFLTPALFVMAAVLWLIMLTAAVIRKNKRSILRWALLLAVLFTAFWQVFRADLYGQWMGESRLFQESGGITGMIYVFVILGMRFCIGEIREFMHDAGRGRTARE